MKKIILNIDIYYAYDKQIYVPFNIDDCVLSYFQFILYELDYNM